MTTIGSLLMQVLGSSITNGLWPGQAPDQSVAPYGTYQHFGNPNYFLKERAPDQRQRVQIDLYHSTQDACATLADTIVALMDAQSINTSPSVFTATQLSHEYMGEDEDVKLHRFMLEFSVWYRP